MSTIVPEGIDATPDATLDGLLDTFGMVRTSDDARAAIHAHVAQREAALREENAKLQQRINRILNPYSSAE